MVHLSSSLVLAVIWFGAANAVTPALAAEPANPRTPTCICEPWTHTVRLYDAATGKMLDGFQTARQPSIAVATADGLGVLVAEHLPAGRADSSYTSAVVSLIQLKTGEVLKEFPLPNGGTVIKGLAVSPAGKHAAVSHIVARFQRPTVHLRLDWMAGNALTVIDLARMEVLGTVLLDERGRGAANPWGIAFSGDGRTLVVAHAGTHEVSLIDFPLLIDRIMVLPAPVDPDLIRKGLLSGEAKSGGVYTPFFPGKRRLVKLPEGDLGPREVAVVGPRAYVTNYFSETVTAIDLENPGAKPVSFPAAGSDARKVSSNLTRQQVLDAMTPEKRGEFYFHDASICFQGWQSCASCHPGGGRADGLNWDLLNDGIGNPKNTKSLLLAFETPPAMSTGVRESAHAAAIAGLKHILFAEPKEEIVSAIEAYIRSLKPVPSPRLVNGQLSQAARRGQKVFEKAGCQTCHPAPLFTDQREYDVGIRGPHDKPTDKFDTPTLIEIWRTAPYLHDGSAATIREVLTIRNSKDKHGATSSLSAREVDDLCEYVLSL